MSVVATASAGPTLVEECDTLTRTVQAAQAGVVDARSRHDEMRSELDLLIRSTHAQLEGSAVPASQPPLRTAAAAPVTAAAATAASEPLYAPQPH